MPLGGISTPPRGIVLKLGDSRRKRYQVNSRQGKEKSMFLSELVEYEREVNAPQLAPVRREEEREELRPVREEANALQWLQENAREVEA